MPKNRKESDNKLIKGAMIAGTAIAGFFALVGQKIYRGIKFDKVIGKDDPNATVKRINNMKRVAVMIGLAILILIIIMLLLRGCQGGEPPHGSVDIPGNVIDPQPTEITPKADLEFNKDNAEENLSFDVEGMNGGDSESILYRVVATYNSDFVLKYDMTIREDEEFQKLAEILKIKVELMKTDGDALLYDGLLSDMSAIEIALIADKDTTTEYLFRITMYLDAPLSEQYYGQKLIADMSWWIEEQDNISIANNEFTTVSKTTPPDPPAITPNLSFITKNEGDNTAFDMRHIMNGDSQTRYFAFEVTHGEDIKMGIQNAIVTDSKLKEVLNVKVELVGENGNTTLYEGLLKDLTVEHTLAPNNSNKTTVYYKVTVTANGLTEAYCETKIVCDLSWSLIGTTEQLKVPNNSFIAYYKPVTPPDPVVTPDLIFVVKNEGDNTAFDMKDIENGDSQTKYFAFEVTHGEDIKVAIKNAITVDSNLRDVLKVKVELVGENGNTTLYEGLLKDLSVEHTLAENANDKTTVYYKVTVTADGLTETYCENKLVCDLVWSLVGTTEQLKVSNNTFVAYDKPVTPPDPPPPPVITPDLKFIEKNEGDNTAFDMKDIENGDSQTKYFAFEVTHGEDIKVVIKNDVVLDSKLNEVIKVKVELVGENGNTILYEGLLKDLTAEHILPKNDSNKTTVYYKVTVVADGLTEDYCEAKLVCDLSWSLSGTSEQLKVPSNSFVAYDKPVTPPPPPPETATSIELTAKDGYENIPFDVKNMLPGDMATQYYCVSVTHNKSESVRFYINVDTTQKLSNVLRVKIEQLIPDAADKILYDGLMKDCTAVDVSVTATSETITPIYYRITVYTNGAEVGNEYVGESLTADFSWQLQ